MPALSVAIRFEAFFEAATIASFSGPCTARFRARAAKNTRPGLAPGLVPQKDKVAVCLRSLPSSELRVAEEPEGLQ